MAPALPLELCETIIDLVNDLHIRGLSCDYDLPYILRKPSETSYNQHQHVLVTCCLVSRLWLPRARYHLYTAPTVHVSRVDLFYKSLSRHPERGCLANRLVLHADDRCTSHELSLVPVVFPRLLPNIQFLAFCDITIGDLNPKFFNYLRQFNTVHTIFLHDVTFSTPFLLAHFLSSFSSLVHLKTSEVRVRGEPPIRDQHLLARLRNKLVIPHLELEDTTFLKEVYNPIRLDLIQYLSLVWKNILPWKTLTALSSMRALCSLTIVVVGKVAYVNDWLVQKLELVDHAPSTTLRTLNLHIHSVVHPYDESALREQLYRIIISPSIREIHLYLIFDGLKSAQRDSSSIIKTVLPWTHRSGEVTNIDVYERRIRLEFWESRVGDISILSSVAT